MTAPIKFDFSSYLAEIPAIAAIQAQEHSDFSAPERCDLCDSAIPEQVNRPKIAEPQESQATQVKNAESLLGQPLPQNRIIAGIAAVYDDFQDDRHFCRECLNIRNGYCIKQRFRPVDDLPRRCEDFKGYPSVIDHRGERKTSEAEHNAQGLFFKFLISRQDGSQFYSCSMPRMTLAEVREQYPDAAAIDPVTGEDYGDEG
jgi:hypothetical protein